MPLSAAVSVLISDSRGPLLGGPGFLVLSGRLLSSEALFLFTGSCSAAEAFLFLPLILSPPFFLCFCTWPHHTLAGADPSLNAAYPRVVEPSLRRVRPRGAVVRARLDTGFLRLLAVFLL